MGARKRAHSQFVLANQILKLVGDEKLSAGQHLTESSLADRFEISRTPVRTALILLADRKIVRARPNRGFVLLKDWRELSNSKIQIPSTAEEKLSSALIRDRLAHRIPRKIKQADLIARYRTSRDILQRVLRRLIDEGIVEKNKGHGWTFLPTIETITGLRSSYDFRKTLEPAAFLLDSFDIDPTALERLLATHRALLDRGRRDEMPGRQLFEIDADFHEVLASFTQNSFFINAIRHQNRLRRLFEYEGYSDWRRVRGWVKEHLSIIEALSNGDRQFASERMREHLSNAFEAAVRHLKPPSDARDAASRRPRIAAGKAPSAHPAVKGSNGSGRRRQ